MLTYLAARVTVLVAATPTPAPSAGGGGAQNIQIPKNCGGAVAPADIEPVFNQLLGWVKWGTIAIMTIAFFAAVGMMIWGRVTYHPRGARIGFDVLVVVLVAAVIYVGGYSLIQSITKC